MTTMLEHIARIEAEYGESFAEVLRGYATDGESVHATAGILEIPYNTFRLWLNTHGPKDIEWARYARSQGWRDAIPARVRSPARARAARENLRKAWAGYAAACAARSPLTPEVLAKVHALRSTTPPLAWRKMPAALGLMIDPTTIERRYKRDYA